MLKNGNLGNKLRLNYLKKYYSKKICIPYTNNYKSFHFIEDPSIIEIYITMRVFHMMW